ncbi:MAG: glycosyltransferase family 2 protein [Halothiobacillaceae bacterium]
MNAHNHREQQEGTQLPPRASQRAKAAIIIPTLNAGPLWPEVLEACLKQTGIAPHDILIIDSSSEDNTLAIAQSHGVRCMRIPRQEFTHGGTRNLAAQQFHEYDFLIFLTQDAKLQTPQTIQRLLKAFESPRIAIAYGRHIPYPNAHPIEAAARRYNYPPQSRITCPENAGKLGIKAVFTSNTFCAYRNNIFKELGGFDNACLISEDMEFAARALSRGYCIQYIAEACVLHSHHVKITQDFRRYLKIGAFHKQYPWIQNTYGKNKKEGLEYTKNLVREMKKQKPKLLPYAIINTANRWLAYQLGRFILRQ